MFVLYIKKKIQNRLAYIVEVSGAGDVLYTSSQVSSMSCMSRNHCKCTCCSVYSLGFFCFFFPLGPHFYFSSFEKTSKHSSGEICTDVRHLESRPGSLVQKRSAVQGVLGAGIAKRCRWGAEEIDACSALGLGTSASLTWRPSYFIYCQHIICQLCGIYITYSLTPSLFQASTACPCRTVS